ncbi:unnamed protein product, partial [marine sediment metagenome]
KEHAGKIEDMILTLNNLFTTVLPGPGWKLEKE